MFGGTSDEHALIKRLLAAGYEVTVSVASDLGSRLIEKRPGLTVRQGRLDAGQMISLMSNGGFICAIDATHPYAADAGANIAAAAKETGLALFRLERGKTDLSGCEVVESAEKAALALTKTEGNVLLTTGSKELFAFCSHSDLLPRLYPRVLPTVESVKACVDMGIPQSHIIAMQGPFSHELNLALIRQFKISTLVTKDGGAAGGMQQKLSAARESGCRIIVISRPREGGLNLDGIIDAVKRLPLGGVKG